MTAHSLSSAVAEKLGIPAFKEYAYYIGSNEVEFAFRQVYLEDDNDRCFKLMCEYGLLLSIGKLTAIVIAQHQANGGLYQEEYSCHPSKVAATRHAILKCILEI